MALSYSSMRLGHGTRGSGAIQSCPDIVEVRSLCGLAESKGRGMSRLRTVWNGCAQDVQ